MRKFFPVLFIICFSINCVAQNTPSKKISYQAVVFDKITGTPLIVREISVRISLLKSINGTALYVETHQIKSNANGLISLQIGGGQRISGNFNSINWGQPLFLQTEIDPNQIGERFIEINTIKSITEILSVPSANYSDTTRSSKLSDTAKFSLKSDTAKFSLKSDTAKFATKSDSTKIAQQLSGDAWNFVGLYSQTNEEVSGFYENERFAHFWIQGNSLINYLDSNHLAWIYNERGNLDYYDEKLGYKKPNTIVLLNVVSPYKFTAADPILQITGELDTTKKELTITINDGIALKLIKLN